MTLLLLAGGVALVLFGLIALVLPAIPGLAVIYLGLWIIAFAHDFARISGGTLLALAAVMVVGLLADNVAGLFGARRAGASGWGVFGAGLGAFVGIFFGLPGVILGPAIGAVAFEYFKNPDVRRAGRAGAGSLVGFLLGILAKYVFAAIMISIAALAYFV